MLTDMISLFQLITGLIWLLPLVVFAPSVARVWTGKMDVVDVLISPMVFIAITNIGFTVRWFLYADAIALMTRNELVLWSGLYTLSCLCAVVSLLAWRQARKFI